METYSQNNAVTFVVKFDNLTKGNLISLFVFGDLSVVWVLK